MENLTIDDAVREKYDKNFDSKFYLDVYFGSIYNNEKFTIQKINDLFTEGKLEGPLERCIDIGSGPIIHRLGPASKVCDALVYSDYSENNRKLVQEWLDESVPSSKNHHLFKVIAELEGYSDLEKGAIEIEERVKSKVEGVIDINVLNPDPIGDHVKLFDFAFSGACLESACDSYDSYVNAIKNIGTILRPGAYFVIKGFTECNYYVVNGVKFPCFFQTIEMVEKALGEGGYRLMEIEKCPEEQYPPDMDISAVTEITDCKGSFVAIAQKL